MAGKETVRAKPSSKAFLSALSEQYPMIEHIKLPSKKQK